jgi:hypothetical protein
MRGWKGERGIGKQESREPGRAPRLLYVKPFGEPAIDGGQQLASFVTPGVASSSSGFVQCS